jgi:muramoyltetrapeptide carboxypeptidase LdcA involved in peptidoglycan recycling
MSIPPKLKVGDEIRVLALSRSLGGIIQFGGLTESDVNFATSRLESIGLKVTFGRHVRECNAHLTASPEHRLEDFHEAISDPSVNAILAVTGGMGASQILDGINYDLVKAHPKIICGYSDVAFVCNAVLARAGVTTYYGPNFGTFLERRAYDYLLHRFRECLFTNDPIELLPASQWSDDAWVREQENRTFHAAEGFWAEQEGEASGTVIGGSCFVLNLLQGTRYFPPLAGAVLFLEQPANGKATLMELDGGLRSLTFLPEFKQVRGLVIGRYGRSGGVTRENLTDLLQNIPALRHLPVIANCDFGHTTPMCTVPVGGQCHIRATKGQAFITFTTH